uniref:Uncharacterized protein n=1 Tax=Physcomitrium patens TaxID=3218 RepID=A0A2K1K3E6_PHYPA|nr:hypothetical protein PHYPA_012778 [Physcomitrium patens]
MRFGHYLHFRFESVGVGMQAQCEGYACSHALFSRVYRYSQAVRLQGRFSKSSSTLLVRNALSCLMCTRHIIA